MPRSKPRKTERGQFSPESMRDALKLVRNGCKPRKAAKQFNLSHATLARYIKRTKDVPDLSTVKLSPTYVTRQVFTSQQEDALADYVLECSRMGYGLTAEDIRNFAYGYATANDCNLPNGWERNRSAGNDWYLGFMSRHKNLSARKPEQCSVARAMAFNKPNIIKYFDNLEAVLRRHKSFADGSRLFNLDETGTSTVGEVKGTKVIGEKGCKQLHQIKSAERGVLVTTCCIIGANGSAVPPVMIFPQAKFVTSMTHNAYPGTLGLASKRGWMTAELFVLVLKHFIEKTGSTKENPSLLILDNVSSHLSIEAIDLCRENGVTLLTLPPPTTHKTQPLDVGVFGPFQTAYSRAYHNWTVSHPGVVCSIYDVAGLVNEALCKAATPTNIFSASRATGIFSFNREIFSDLDFVPSKVTENPDPGSVQNQEEREEPGNKSDAQDIEEAIIDDPPPIPSTSTTQPDGFVTPRKIRPLPKAKPKDVTRKPRETGRSRVATDSAEKEEIKNKTDAKRKKDEEAENKRKEKARKSLEILLQGKKKNEVKNFLKVSGESKGKKRNAQAGGSKNPSKRPTKPLTSSSESESEGDEILNISDQGNDEELWEGDENYQNGDSDKEEDPENFMPLQKSLEEGDHVLVQFQLVKENKYYVAKVLKEKDEEGDLEVSYYRTSGKVINKFVLPQIPDLKSVHISNVKKILPKPIYGITARQKNLISFDFDFSALRMG